ncbi:MULTISPECIES: TRAP transporter small permease [unclassified Roseitalea]|uniref:TRAP transporter small permease n=1 Tax=unclassified Roseitalea TaxID=2639107 RepID=UPI00273FAEAE|nr:MULTISPECIES: TRAP transporter small permease [unclassified Roseitalea]
MNASNPITLGSAIRTVLSRWEETLAVVALCVVVVAVSYGVITRHVTQTPATWATELASLSFTWVVFLGAAGAMRRHMHVSVDAITRILPRAVAGPLAWLADLLVLAFLAYTLWLAFGIMIDANERPSPVLRISFTWVYLAVVLSFGSMLVHHVLHMLERLRTGIHPALEAVENRQGPEPS